MLSMVAFIMVKAFPLVACSATPWVSPEITIVYKSRAKSAMAHNSWDRLNLSPSGVVIAGVSHGRL